MLLDVPTIFAGCALSNCLIALVLALGARHWDMRRSGAGFLLAALVAMTCSFALRAPLLAPWPWVGIVVANGFVGLGALLYWRALRQLYGYALHPAAVLLPVALLLVVDGSLYAVQGDSVLRGSVASLFLAAMFALPGILALRRYNENAAFGRTQALIAAGFLGGSLILALRFAWGMSGPAPAEFQFRQTGVINLALLLVLYSAMIIGSFGFLLMLRERDLLRLAMLDGLTGVMNRRAMLEQMRSALAFARRAKIACSVILLDLDHFKRINDTRGHAMGDSVLRHFARLARGLLRSEDVLGRYGGEEFALLLPGTPAAEAQVFAGRLREALAAQPLRSAKEEVRYTASLGITEWRPGSEADIEALLEQADQALYAAKRDGRDRSVLFHPALHAA